jgi:hypothetical protein
LWNGEAPRLMRAYTIADRILKGELALQDIALLRMRQSLTHPTPATLARGEVVTLDIRRVDLLATKHLREDGASTEADAAADLDYASLLAPFIYLRIESCRIQTCVGCTSRLKWRWTTAPCGPARANQ